MNIFKLSIKNIFNKPLSSLITVVLLGLGIGIISLLIQLNSLIKDQMENNLRGIDMVVGAKGCLLYTSPSPRDIGPSRMPSSA